MNASGGAAAPLNDASEEFGATAPRNEQVGDDETSASNNDASGSSNAAKGTSGSSAEDKGASSSSNGRSSTSNNQQASSKSSSGAQSSSRTTRSSNKEQGKNDLEDVQREKAERFVNLNEEDVANAGANDDAKSSSQRAPRDVGSKDDVEQLHGKADAGKSDDKKRASSRGCEQQGAEKSRKQDGNASGKGNDGVEGHKHDHEHDPMRHNAAKFVNIEE